MKGFGFYFKIVDRIAICSVYMACESPLNNDYKTWNDLIYAELDRELEVLENDGYKCVIVGDLNAHVGLPPRQRFFLDKKVLYLSHTGSKF